MKVTSLAEVWIEIFVVRMHRYIMQSLPLRKCGLKFIFIAIPHFRDTVTSLAEVWIEIPLPADGIPHQTRQFPCGSVD